MAQRRRRNQKSEQEETLVDLVQKTGEAQSFLEQNQKTILGVVAAVVILIGAYVAYSMFYKQPKEIKASAQMFKAEQAFVQDSMTKALTDPGGGYPGFIDMVKRYGSTNAGDVSNLYAAMSYLQEGKYEAAIDYLGDYDGGGKLGDVIRNGIKGDAYSELGNMDKAMSAYKSASKTDNEFFAPYYLYKVGLLSEKQGDKSAALSAYTKIKKEYPTSAQGQTIDAFIARVSE
jgi:tetratricopeptide (TPR) repeat protein